MGAAVQHVRGLDFFAMADGLGKKINLPAHPCRAWREVHAGLRSVLFHLPAVKMSRDVPAGSG
jgi:hypothetical protein